MILPLKTCICHLVFLFVYWTRDIVLIFQVSRNLFRWTKEIAYADYYERALTNGVLSIQRGREPGVMLYLLSLEPGKSKKDNSHGWGTQFESFWCCYGTGIVLTFLSLTFSDIPFLTSEPFSVFCKHIIYLK